MKEPITQFNYPMPTPAPAMRPTLPAERAEIECMVDQFMKSGGVIEQVPFGKVTGVEPMHMTAKQMNAQSAAIAKAKKRK